MPLEKGKSIVFKKLSTFITSSIKGYLESLPKEAKTKDLQPLKNLFKELQGASPPQTSLFFQALVEIAPQKQSQVVNLLSTYGGSQFTKEAILREIFNDKKVDGEKLYQFLKNNEIESDSDYFLQGFSASVRESTPLAEDFKKARQQTIQEFMVEKKWGQNTQVKDKESNKELLLYIMGYPETGIFPEVYSFLKKHNASTDMTYIQYIWRINARNADAEANTLLLKNLIEDPSLSHDHLRQFFKDVKIHPHKKGGWFRNKEGRPTALKNLLLEKKPELYHQLYKKTQLPEDSNERVARYGYNKKEATLRPINPETKKIIGSKIRKYQQSISYSTYAAKKVRKQEIQEQNINQFDKIENSENLNLLSISKAFEKELVKALNENLNEKMIRALPFVTTSFSNVLDQLTNEFLSPKTTKQIYPKDIENIFSSRFFDDLSKKNRYTEQIDREIFKAIAGVNVKGGTGKPVEEINFDSPDIQALIRDYNQGTWGEEERTLTYKVMDDETFSEMKIALNKVIENESFKKVLIKFFFSKEKGVEIAKEWKEKAKNNLSLQDDVWLYDLIKNIDAIDDRNLAIFFQIANITSEKGRFEERPRSLQLFQMLLKEKRPKLYEKLYPPTKKESL